MLFELALRRGGMTYPLIVTRDGQEAVEYLSGKGSYSDRLLHPLPSLIVLDLKMPKMTGFDVTCMARLPARSATYSSCDPVLVVLPSGYAAGNAFGRAGLLCQTSFTR